MQHETFSGYTLQRFLVIRDINRNPVCTRHLPRRQLLLHGSQEVADVKLFSANESPSDAASLSPGIRNVPEKSGKKGGMSGIPKGGNG